MFAGLLSSKIKLICTCFIVIASILFFVYPPVVHADISSNLIGWWKLDDGTGTTIIDSSGGGSSGALINNPSWTTGKISGGLSFLAGATADRVVISSNIGDNLAAPTVSAWVKVTNAGFFFVDTEFI